MIMICQCVTVFRRHMVITPCHYRDVYANKYTIFLLLKYIRKRLKSRDDDDDDEAFILCMPTIQNLVIGN
jgi:Na+-transporting NADH:ubiquinone oxidoreductase subunit NqrF